MILFSTLTLLQTEIASTRASYRNISLPDAEKGSLITWEVMWKVKKKVIWVSYIAANLISNSRVHLLKVLGRRKVFLKNNIRKTVLSTRKLSCSKFPYFKIKIKNSLSIYSGTITKFNSSNTGQEIRKIFSLFLNSL